MEGLASEEATIKLYSITFLLHTTFISVGSLEGQNWQMNLVQRYLLDWLA